VLNFAGGTVVEINSGVAGLVAALLGIPALGSLIVVGWCAVASFTILKAIDATIGLRVSKETEIEGLDLNLHGEVVP
jgi:Amt family ammonium transporter